MLIVNIPLFFENGRFIYVESFEVFRDFLSKIEVNESFRILDRGLIDFEEMGFENFDFKFCGDLIYRKSFGIFEEGRKVIFLSGSHGNSYSLVRAFFDHCQNSDEDKIAKEPCLIVFDSRVDLKEGNFNFGWLRKLIEDGFTRENIFLVGARNFGKEEVLFMKENGIKFMGMNQIRSDLQDSTDIIMEFSSGKELYVSFDLGFGDPSFVSSKNNDIGGLSSVEIIYLIQRLSKMKNLKAIDFTGFDIESLNSNMEFCSKLVGEML